MSSRLVLIRCRLLRRLINRWVPPAARRECKRAGYAALLAGRSMAWARVEINRVMRNA